MRIRTRIILAVIMLFVGIAVGIAMQPGNFRISRSAIVSAPPAVVFAQVNDFHLWEAWSPWAKLDPSAKNSFEGPASGSGAIFRWAGNSEVGEGAMTIMESVPNDRIDIKLEFLRPFAATHRAEFTFRPEGDQTRVTWIMTGQNNFIGKVISHFIDCDKMLGEYFEKGLAQMKTVAEASSKQ